MTPYGCREERVNGLFTSFVSAHWRKIIIPVAALAAITAFLFYPREQSGHHLAGSGETPLLSFEEADTEELIEESITEEIMLPVTIMVDVRGAVSRPGVYSLSEGSRVIDAISAAGGYLKDADPILLNQALKLADEMHIYVPFEGEETVMADQAVISTPAAETADSGTVNLNTAGEQELMTLPGVGPSKAAAIIQYREQHGAFKTAEELMNVSGIGEKTFEKLQQLISVQ